MNARNLRNSLWCADGRACVRRNAGAAPADAAAQAWPTRPIRLIVPFPPGGATDANARAIAKEVETVLGQPLVIDNRGGANAIIGCDLVAKSAPDGYTLMHISVAFAINPSTYKKLPFDTSRDFTPITNPIVGQGSLLAVNAVGAGEIGHRADRAREEAEAFVRLARASATCCTSSPQGSWRARASRCCTCRTRARAPR